MQTRTNTASVQPRKFKLGAGPLTLTILMGMAAAAPAWAGGCVVQGNRMIGDCGNVHIGGPAKPLVVFSGGTHSGNFDRVVIRQRGDVQLSGNAEHIVVEPGARLTLSGNARHLEVWGLAELTGNMGRVIVHRGGTAVLQGTAEEALGPGRVIAQRGSVVGGVPMN
jgi:hypothetical protein